MDKRHEGLIIGIASPGDVAEERAAVKAACERLNLNLAPKLGFTLAVVMWEDQASGSGRPQELINGRLDDADVLIGLMHRRWGTATGEYSSGFEEEYERARARRGTGTHPEIKMYFKKVDVASVEDPGPQLSKVLAFKNGLRDGNDLLYGEFETAGQLERDVYDALVVWLIDRANPAPEKPDGSREDELKYRLAEAITELPENDRVVFTLKYYEGLTMAEIGGALAIDEREVADAVSNALQHLGDRLGNGLTAELERFIAQPQTDRPAVGTSAPVAAAEEVPSPSGTMSGKQLEKSTLPALTDDPSDSESKSSTAAASPDSAIEQLKAWLPDPANHIRIQDLFEAETDKVRAEVRKLPIHLERLDVVALQTRTAHLLELTKPLLELVCTGVRYDRDLAHTDTWVAGLQTLLAARPRPVPGQPYQDLLERLRHFPALLYLRAAGTVAVARDRDQVLIRLMTEPVWRAPMLADSRISATQALHEWRLFEPDTLRNYPRFTAKWFYPASVMLREDLREIVSTFLPDQDEYEQACDDYEYRVALLTQLSQSEPGAYQAGPGMFMGERSWEWDHPRRPYAEVAFQARADRADDSWPWWQVVGGRSALPNILAELREYLRGARRFG
ncbi:sigma factor-like helix-turn-helix DNA-binding protein [Microbacterium sp. ARD31]|uniref:sigma factor-like helix-turn-helix DNA-binding protein n=1 Tax=Microbacterium sp. ARD31 TaxID=2962576 RepID=UPI0028823D84|nr:sigma factor-like helix-turn-helix DNA-binding protein [Microbacterium sp. ARD31]MDT0188072.1 sigma factor-like helix-turn-helix DNA-binding protein [Microbacterium sp. ARD31]